MKAAIAALLLAAGLAACASDPPAPKPEAPPPVPRVGTVGLVSEVKTRGVNRDNWKSAVTGVYYNDNSGNVTGIHYEVTVLYEDHTQGVVTVPTRPDLRPGQRVRVTGDKIELLPR
jgi:hypothetical protein